MVTWVEVWERTFEVLMIKLLVEEEGKEEEEEEVELLVEEEEEEEEVELLVEEEEVGLLVEEGIVVNVEVVGVSTGKFKAIIITNSWVGVANE